MSEKSFGIKELNLMSASGTPTIESPNDIVFKSGGSNERVRITSGGNMGVGGLASPGALLSIPAGESNTPRLAIESAVDANDFTITQYEDGNGTYTMLGQNVKLNSSGNNTILDSGHRTAGILLDARNNGAITFLTGGANSVGENVKIDSNGRTNISNTGITNDDFQLQVESSTSRPAAKFYRKRNTAGGGLIEIYDDVGGTETRQFHFATGGHLTLDKGNLVIGTSGQGIDFSSAAGSNAGSSNSVLDDYEEGTYTPTFTCTSGSITLNGSYNIICYEKIGNTCHVHGRVRVSSVSSPSGSLVIGLPFTRSNPGEDSARIGGTCVVQNGSGAVSNYLIHPTGSTGVELARGDTSSIDVTVADNFSGDELVYISVTYRTA